MTLHQICQNYQQPTYAYDERRLWCNYKRYQQCLSSACGIYYSIKANPNFEIIQSLYRAGAGMEVSSLYELYLATSAGVPAKKIVFIGPGKQLSEINACINMNIMAIYCESLAELELIECAAQQQQRNIEVVLRIANTKHSKGHRISMSGPNSQFGMDLDTVRYINNNHRKWPFSELVGVHFYQGTNQQKPEHTQQQILSCCQQFEMLQQAWHRPMTILGLGLGVGKLTAEMSHGIATSQCWAKPITALQKTHPSLAVACEAGRCLVASSGDLVAQVQYTKKIGTQHWAVLDTGYHHHMNLCFENNFLHKHPGMRVIKNTPQPTRPNKVDYNLCGPLCTPSDRIRSQYHCQTLHRGDFIVFLDVAAYALSHSPIMFLGQQPAAEVFIKTKQQMIQSNTLERFFQFHTHGDHYASNTQR